MIKELIKLANHLDSKGYIKEADYLDKAIKKYAAYSEDEKLARLVETFKTYSERPSVSADVQSHDYFDDLMGANSMLDQMNNLINSLESKELYNKEEYENEPGFSYDMEILIKEAKDLMDYHFSTINRVLKEDKVISEDLTLDEMISQEIGGKLIYPRDDNFARIIYNQYGRGGA